MEYDPALLNALAAVTRKSLSAMQLSLGSLREELGAHSGDRAVGEWMDRLAAEIRRAERQVAGYERLCRAPELEVDAVVPSSLIEQALLGLQEEARHAGVHVQAWLDTHIPSIEMDRAFMLQALGILLRHALSTLPSGGTLTVTSRALEGGWSLEIIDTGPGISAALAARLFDASYPDGPGDRAALGFVRHAVTAHGGEVTCESEPGVGTRIQLVLPTRGSA